MCALYDLTIPLQGIYPGEILANVHQEMDKMMFKLIHFVKTKNGNDPNVH